MIQKNKKMKTTNGNTTNGKYMNKHVYMESEKKEKIKIFKEIIVESFQKNMKDIKH